MAGMTEGLERAIRDILGCVPVDVVDVIPEVPAFTACVAVADQYALTLGSPCLAARIQCSSALAVLNAGLDAQECGCDPRL